MDGVCVCVPGLLFVLTHCWRVFVCVCVRLSQDKDIEGEEEEEEAVTAVSKVNSTTSQLFGHNTDTNTLFASKLLLNFFTVLLLTVAHENYAPVQLSAH